MIGREALMSSARTGDDSKDEWSTPAWIVSQCEDRFFSSDRGFTLDAAATAENAVASNYYSNEDSALSPDAKWTGSVWCNPPYSLLRQFADKAIEQIQLGNCQSVTFLIPARTDTRAFQLLAKYANRIVFLAGRVRFDGPDGKAAAACAPFPSAIVHITATPAPAIVSFEDWRK